MTSVNLMYKGAIVGLGNVALEGHMPAWRGRSDFQIAAGVDTSAERLAAFKKILPESRTYASLEDCLKAEKLDFVDIAAPPHTHFDLAKTALRAGLHVLCEKPLVLESRQVRELDLDRTDSGKVLVTVHNWKYAPICRRISKLIRDGVLGELTRLDWYVLRSGPSITVGSEDNWRLNPKLSGGGILVDHGWHAFYLAVEWMGGEPSKVTAHLENRQYEDLPVEDTAKIHMEFPGGRKIAEIFLTWASRLRKNSGLLEGNAGRVHMEDDRLILEKRGTASETIPFESALSEGSFHPEWFNLVIEEFLSEIKDPSLSGRNFAVARACVDLLEKSKESSQKGGVDLVFSR